jgi:CheY-like chemotaxis protein
MHGGQVAAFSDGPGQGSEFVFTLPLLEEGGARAAGAGIAEAGPTRGFKRILVVDDNADAADAIAMLLRSSGHEVHTAYGAPEALGRAAEMRPDMILLDIGLPGMNGYELARELRRVREDVLLIALTGYGQDKDRREAREAGFDHHLTKPVDLDGLNALLD